MLPTYSLLALAVLALWLGAPSSGNRVGSLWVWLAVGAIASGLFTHVLQPRSVLWLGAFGAAVLGFARSPARPRVAAASALAIVVLATGLMIHRLPGFDNPVILRGVRITPDAVPFSLYLNFDKTFVGLCLLGWCHPRLRAGHEWRAALAQTAPRALATMAVVLLLSLAAGYVRLAPKVPSHAMVWLTVNLLSTCVAEEAFFRGFLQRQLQRLWAARAHGAPLALVVCAILFGFAHAAGGLAYVLLATVAGLGYGWIYLGTNRIEASIITHFALNTVHFFLFTYPALQR